MHMSYARHPLNKSVAMDESTDDSPTSTSDNMNWSLPDQDDENTLNKPASDTKSEACLPAVDATLFCEEKAVAPFEMTNGTLAPDGYYYKLSGRLTIEVYDVKSKQCINTIPIPEFKEEDLNYGCLSVSSIEELRWSNILVTGNHHIILWSHAWEPYKIIVLAPDTHQIKYELYNCMLIGPFHHVNESQFLGSFATEINHENGHYLFELTSDNFTRKRLDTPLIEQPSEVVYQSYKTLPNGKIMMSAVSHIFTLADGRLVERARITDVIDGTVAGEAKPVGIIKKQLGILVAKWEKDTNGNLVREAVLPLQSEKSTALSQMKVISANTIGLATFVGKRMWELKIIDTDNMKVIKDLGKFCDLEMYLVGTQFFLHEKYSDKVYFLNQKSFELQEEKLPCYASQLKQISEDCLLLQKNDGTWMKMQIAHGVITEKIADSISCFPIELARLSASYYPRICEVPIAGSLSGMSMFAQSEKIDESKENAAGGLVKQKRF